MDSDGEDTPATDTLGHPSGGGGGGGGSRPGTPTYRTAAGAGGSRPNSPHSPLPVTAEHAGRQWSVAGGPPGAEGARITARHYREVITAATATASSMGHTHGNTRALREALAQMKHKFDVDSPDVVGYILDELVEVVLSSHADSAINHTALDILFRYMKHNTSCSEYVLSCIADGFASSSRHRRQLYDALTHRLTDIFLLSPDVFLRLAVALFKHAADVSEDASDHINQALQTHWAIHAPGLTKLN